MRPADRFGNDIIDDFQLFQIDGCNPHIASRILRPAGIAPKNGGGAFR